MLRRNIIFSCVFLLVLTSCYGWYGVQNFSKGVFPEVSTDDVTGMLDPEKTLEGLTIDEQEALQHYSQQIDRCIRKHLPLVDDGRMSIGQTSTLTYWRCREESEEMRDFMLNALTLSEYDANSYLNALRKSKIKRMNEAIFSMRRGFDPMGVRR